MRLHIIFILFSILLTSCSQLSANWERYPIDNILKPGTSVVKLIPVNRLHCYLIGTRIISGTSSSEKKDSKFKAIICETTNGGKIWNEIDSFNDGMFINGEVSNNIISLIYIENQSGVAHLLYKNLGTSTKFIEFSTYRGFINYARVLTSKTAYIYADEHDNAIKYLYFTDNNGVSWMKINRRYGGEFLSCENEKMFFIKSEKCLNNNLIVYDLNNRKEEILKLPDTLDIHFAQYFNNNYYLFCSEKEHCCLWKVNDEGKLTKIHTFEVKEGDLGPFGFYCFKNEIIALALSSTTSPAIYFFKSTDNGDTWTDLAFPFSYNVGKFSFSDKSGLDIWITGGINEILRYRDN